MDSKYKGRRISALDAQRTAHEIAFAPVVFQVSRLMINYGIFGMLEAAGRSVPAGLTAEEVAEKAGISVYGAKVLLESSLTAGTVFLNDGRFTISKVGWFLLNDPMVRSDIDFNHDVNYKGLFHLDEAVRTGKPAGLKELGPWPTLYEGLSSLEPRCRKAGSASTISIRTIHSNRLCHTYLRSRQRRFSTLAEIQAVSLLKP